MNTQEILRMIGDNSITDDAVFNALKDYLTDKYNAEGQRISPSSEDLQGMEAVREKTISQRPLLFQKLHDYVVEGHRYCCGPEANGT